MCGPAGQCPWWMSLYGSLTPNRHRSCPTMMDRAGGDRHTNTHTHKVDSYTILLRTRNSADVTGHGLCTNYVRDSCGWWGPCQRQRLPSKGGRQAESITQHQQAKSVENTSWVCATNGLVVRKRRLWTKIEACLTPAYSLLCLTGRRHFPAIYLFTGK